MSVISAKLPEFPGFGIRYDPKAKPYFQSNVIEELRIIKSKPLGKTLLESIANARPRARKASSRMNEAMRAVTFSKGINVVIVPTSVQFTQSGSKMAYTGVGVEKSLAPSSAASHNIKDCPFHIAGGSAAEAVDATAGTNGQGTVSIMHYTNAQIITGKGEAAKSFIVLAHELIHCLHHVTGTGKNHDEEKWTSGIVPYADEPMSENAFRTAFGLPLRLDY